MSTYQYKQYQQKKEQHEKAKIQNAKCKYRSLVVRILMREKLQNVTGIEVESIFEDTTDNNPQIVEVVFRCKIRYRKTWYRIFLKLGTPKSYKMIEIDADEALIQKGMYYLKQ